MWYCKKKQIFLIVFYFNFIGFTGSGDTEICPKCRNSDMDMMDKLVSHPKRLDSPFKLLSQVSSCKHCKLRWSDWMQLVCQGDVLPSPKLQLQAAEDSDSEVEILLKWHRVVLCCLCWLNEESVLELTWKGMRFMWPLKLRVSQLIAECIKSCASA